MSDSPASARAEEIKGLFAQYVVPTYGRFDLVMERGEGRELWDVDGKRYLDLGSGIAVCSLGHSNPELADAISEQARSLVHCSNLYYYETQGRLAQRIVEGISPGNLINGKKGKTTLRKMLEFFTLIFASLVRDRHEFIHHVPSETCSNFLWLPPQQTRHPRGN